MCATTLPSAATASTEGGERLEDAQCSRPTETQQSLARLSTVTRPSGVIGCNTEVGHEAEHAGDLEAP